MPELPEVETTCRGISPHIIKHKVITVNIYQPKMRWPIDRQLSTLLPGQVLQRVDRRGKYLVLHFDSGTMLLHLGMSGSLRVLDKKSELEKHDHFELIFDNHIILRLRDPRRFGAVIWCEHDWQQHELIKHLGPEPLSDDFNGEYLFAQSRNKTVAVKNFIMNAHIVVGVGNIYASESLFIAGINPKRSANKISAQRYLGLANAIKLVLSKAIQQGGTTLKDFSAPDGKPGYFAQQLNVYGRSNQPCLQCNHTIKHCVIGQRATYYCPTCQH